MPTASLRRCPECATALEASPSRGEPKAFCQPSCRVAYNNRLKSRGQAVVALAMTWRAGRGSSATAKLAYAELCAVLDLFNAEDKAQGRPPVHEHTARVLARGRFIDRKRS